MFLERGSASGFTESYGKFGKPAFPVSTIRYDERFNSTPKEKAESDLSDRPTVADRNFLIQM